MCANFFLTLWRYGADDPLIVLTGAMSINGVKIGRLS